jgi:hypothetical protein
MSIRRLSALALAAGLPLAAPGLLEAQAAVERYSLSGDSVAVYNLVGQVSVEPGGQAGGPVVVEVRRLGAEAGRLRLVKGVVRGRESLRVLYPSDEIRYAPLGRGSRTELRVADDGTWDGETGRWSSEHVRISGDRGLDASADIRVLVPAGQRAAVYLAVGRMTARNVDGRLHLDGASASVVAEGIRGGLSVDVGSGDVRATRIEGAVLLDTGSGDVTVDDVQTGGESLVIDTGSGEVRGDNLRGRTLSIDTGSGEVLVAGVAADDVMVDTGSGDVELTLVADVSRLVIDTGSGSVVVRAPASTGAQVTLDTSSGDLSTDFELAARSDDEDTLTGRIGDGRGEITIDTGSGDIRLLRR